MTEPALGGGAPASSQTAGRRKRRRRQEPALKRVRPSANILMRRLCQQAATSSRRRLAMSAAERSPRACTRRARPTPSPSTLMPGHSAHSRCVWRAADGAGGVLAGCIFDSCVAPGHGTEGSRREHISSTAGLQPPPQQQQQQRQQQEQDEGGGYETAAPAAHNVRASCDGSKHLSGVGVTLTGRPSGKNGGQPGACRRQGRHLRHAGFSANT